MRVRLLWLWWSNRHSGLAGGYYLPPLPDVNELVVNAYDSARSMPTIVHTLFVVDSVSQLVMLQWYWSDLERLFQFH